MCEHEFSSLSPSDLFLLWTIIFWTMWSIRVFMTQKKVGESGRCSLNAEVWSFSGALVAFFITALWRDNSRTIPFTSLKFTIQWFLVSSYSFSTLTTILERFITTTRIPIPIPISSQCSLPHKLPALYNLSLCGFYWFSCSGYFI